MLDIALKHCLVQQDIVLPSISISNKVERKITDPISVKSYGEHGEVTTLIVVNHFLGIYGHYHTQLLRSSIAYRKTYTIPARSTLTIIPYGCRSTATS